VAEKWLIDFDSVLSNTFVHQIEKLNEEFGLSMTHEDFFDWDTRKFLTKEQADFMWGPEVFLNEDFQIECTPIEGGRQFLQKLVARGDDFVVVSDRQDALYDVTSRWLERNIGSCKLFLTKSPKYMGSQSSGMTKQDVVVDLGLNKIVDDAPHHAVPFASIESVERVYLMNTPSNQHVEETDKIVRAHGWSHVERMERVVLPV